MVHELKTWIEFFQSSASGQKNFELRRNDRGFKAGHELLLQEYDKDTNIYTGRKLRRRITYVLQGEEAEKFGLKEGYCIIGLEKI